MGGSEGGGSITAALFLQEFVTKPTGEELVTGGAVAWAHVDMAGPVWNSKAGRATGFGVMTLTEFVLNAAKEKTKSF